MDKNGINVNIETEQFLNMINSNNNKEEGIEMMEIFMKDDIETLTENVVKEKYGMFSPLEVVGCGRKVEFIDVEHGKIVSEYESSSDLVGFRNISNAISKHMEDNYIPPKTYKVGESVQGKSQLIAGGQAIINDNGINILVAMPNITAKEKRAFKQGLIKIHVDDLGGKLPIISFKTDSIFSFDTGIMLESVYGKNVISKDFNTAEDVLEQKRIALMENLKSRKITFYFSESAKNEIVAVRKAFLPKEYVKNMELAVNQQDEYELLKIKLLNYQAFTNTNSVLRNNGEYI